MLKYVQVFVNNKWYAGLNENKEVSFSKNSSTIELCLSIQVCKRREIHAVCVKNADCTCNHSTKNKIQQSYYSSLSAVVLLGLPAYASSLFSILRLSTIPVRDSILAKDITLDRSRAWNCFAQRSGHVYFTSWLHNIGEFRCSMAEIASHYDHVLTLSTILCQVNAGYLYHYPWSETRQTE